MMFSEPLSQYEEILKDAIRTSMKESGAKLAKTFQTLLIEILTLYMILPRKINWQVQLASANLAKSLKNSFFGVEKPSFFLGLKFSFFATLRT